MTLVLSHWLRPGSTRQFFLFAGLVRKEPEFPPYQSLNRSTSSSKWTILMDFDLQDLDFSRNVTGLADFLLVFSQI